MRRNHLTEGKTRNFGQSTKMPRNTRNTRANQQREAHSQPPERRPRQVDNRRSNPRTTDEGVGDSRGLSTPRMTVESDDSTGDIDYVKDTIVRRVSLT